MLGKSTLRLFHSQRRLHWKATSWQSTLSTLAPYGEEKDSTMKKSPKTKKPFWEMTAEEREKATRKFDRPIPLSKTKPMTKREREQFERMQKAPHVSVYIRRSPDDVIVKLDPDVRERSIRYAAAHKLTLSDLVNRSLKGLLTAVD